jgi:NAD(P)-dependent dehydrogenase (short-subunit alcohol dehydrogenase family)
MNRKKTSLVIGGTRGIGSVIARSFADRGDEVITASRRETGTSHRHISVDLSSPDSAAERVLEILSSDSEFLLDSLVFSQRYRGENLDEDLTIMVKATEALIISLQPLFHMGTSIIVLGSNASRFVIAEQSMLYHVIRHGLEGLVRYFAVELGPKGVRINTVLVTTIVKPENENFFYGDDGKQIRELIQSITPIRRMGDAQDVANLVEFLCSDQGSFITGQSILLDGGAGLLAQEGIVRRLLEMEHPNPRPKLEG